VKFGIPVHRGSIFGWAAICFSANNRMLANEFYVVLGFRQAHAGAVNNFTRNMQLFSDGLAVSFQTPATVTVVLSECPKIQSLFKKEQPEPRNKVHVTPPLQPAGLKIADRSSNGPQADSWLNALPTN